jgi:hypothetical protein
VLRDLETVEQQLQAIQEDRPPDQGVLSWPDPLVPLEGSTDEETNFGDDDKAIEEVTRLLSQGWDDSSGAEFEFPTL